MDIVKTVTYKDLRNLMVEEIDGDINIPENKFKSYLTSALKRFFEADVMVEGLISVDSEEDGYNIINLPNALEHLIRISPENIKDEPLHKAMNFENIKTNPQLYYISNTTIYVNSIHKKVHLRYTSNIQNPEKLMFPNHDEYLKALVWFIVWRHLEKRYNFNNEGTKQAVNSARKTYLDYKTMFEHEKDILEIKMIFGYYEDI